MGKESLRVEVESGSSAKASIKPRTAKEGDGYSRRDSAFRP